MVRDVGLSKKAVFTIKNVKCCAWRRVFTTPQEHGAYARSFFEWRVKQSIDNNQMYIAVAMRPDFYAGLEGSPTNYIHFDIDTAVRLRDNLNDCIEFTRQQSKSVGRPRS
jgi:hypothetical protein